MELCLVLHDSLDGRGVWGRVDTCRCMAESLYCPPETIPTVLIGYTPIQKKKKKKNWFSGENQPCKGAASESDDHGTNQRFLWL